MGDRLSLRFLFLITASCAVVAMVIRFAIIEFSRGQEGSFRAISILIALTIPLSIFALYAIFYVLILPYGILSQVAREAIETPASPFASDRLPESQLPTSEPEKAH